MLTALLCGAVGLAAVAAQAGLDDLKEYARAVVSIGRTRPLPTGVFDVGCSTIEVDASSEVGVLPVSLYYPVDRSSVDGPLRFFGLLEALAHPTRARYLPGAPLARSETAFPLLVYFPSWFSHKHENSFTLANLASRGFVVASIDDIARLPRLQGHDGEAQRAGLDASSAESFSASRVLAGHRAELEARIGSKAIDRIAGSKLWGRRVDPDRVGAVGFSFGGGVAATMSRSDPRIRAVVNLDGPLFGNVAEAGVDVPFLTLFSGNPFPTVQDLNQPDLGARFDALLDQVAVEQQLVQDTRPDSWTFVIERTTHLDFSDRLVMPAFADRRGVQELDRLRAWSDINMTLIAFLDTFLRGGSKQRLIDDVGAAGIRTLEAAQKDMAARVARSAEPYP